MAQYLPVLIYIPLAGFLISLLANERRETLISWISFSTVGLHGLAATLYLIWWAVTGFVAISYESVTLYNSPTYQFVVSFFYDKTTAIFLLVGSILSFLVTLYSRYYMHREKGYKRFFNTILFFYSGYTLTVLSGNFETLFIGWEVLGISSFLLIAFYRDRYLPVKNAVKVFSIYRVGDVGILLTMWMSHHLWHQNITFAQLLNAELVHHHLEQHTTVGIFISLAILLAALAKSAQFPFSSWLPRAMEGPTPSSAIFYGSLSVHMGVFLLLRTHPFWEQQTSVRIIIVAMGFITAFIATGIARVQSSVKAQIAYASIAQIGLIFIELALDWEWLALFHFAGNAFLRTYQLLVSPSVVSYLIREQFYTFSPTNKSLEQIYPKKLGYTLYHLCLNEWYLDTIMYRVFWNPLKKVGRTLHFINLRQTILVFLPAYGIGVLLWATKIALPPFLVHSLPYIFCFIGLLMVLKAFTERYRARMSWALVLMNHWWIALAISFNELVTVQHIVLYQSGVFFFGAIGFFALYRIKKLEGSIDLDRFRGHSYEHPRIAFLFLLASLGVSGFPISPTFIGEDLIFSHIHENQLLLAGMVSLSFILDGLAIIRIFARIFLGPHVKTYHETAYRSS